MVADDFAREAGQDRRTHRPARPLRSVPARRGRRAAGTVRRDPAPDRAAAATVAAAPGMSIVSNDRWQPDGRGASMIDRERPNAARSRSKPHDAAQCVGSGRLAPTRAYRDEAE